MVGVGRVLVGCRGAQGRWLVLQSDRWTSPFRYFSPLAKPDSGVMRTESDAPVNKFNPRPTVLPPTALSLPRSLSQ